MCAFMLCVLLACHYVFTSHLNVLPYSEEIMHIKEDIYGENFVKTC